MSKLIGKYIRVKPDPAETKTPSGIIIPTGKIPDTGVVLELSEDMEFDVKVGDKIRFQPNHREEQEDGTIFIRGDDEGAVLFVFNN